MRISRLDERRAIGVVILFCATVCLLVGLVGCSVSRTSNRTIVIGPDANDQTIVLNGSGILLVHLPGNPTTGYSWSLIEVQGQAVKAIGEVEYTPDETGAQPLIVGAGGVFKAMFQAVKPGTSRIRMEYRRPWEKDQPAESVFEVTVQVK